MVNSPVSTILNTGEAGGIYKLPIAINKYKKNNLSLYKLVYDKFTPEVNTTL